MGRFVAGGGGDEAMRLRPRLARNRSMTKAAAEHRRNTDSAVRGVFGRSLARSMMRGAKVIASRIGASLGAAVVPKVPGGPVVAALVVAGIIALRLGTGRSFPNMGENIMDVLLGDMTAESAAKFKTRAAMQANPLVAHAAGRGITKQMRDIGEMIYEQELRKEKSRRLFMTDKAFQTNNIVDMIILRIKQKFVELFSGGDVQHAMDHASKSIGAAQAFMLEHYYVTRRRL